MFQGHEHAGTKAVVVCLIHQGRAALEHVACLFQGDSDGRVKKAMARRYQGGLWFGGVAVGLVKADALVALGDWNNPAHGAVAVAETTWNAGDLIATSLAPPDLTAEPRERFLEEAANIVRL